ncbi:MAG: CoA transferase [Acidimicrobiales bacterium]
MNGALSPYRIVDLSTDTGWLCGKILADLGADVIKVEPPGGDPGRRRGRFDHRHPGDAEHNLGWRFANQHKRSVVLDLHEGGDRDRLLELAAGADALIESFPTGTLEQLDLSPDRLLALNPQLVVTSISPFGRTGPYAHHAASDLTVSAMCGLQWLTGDEDRAPVRIGAPQLFRHAAAEAAAQTAIALHHAARSGTGQHVDVAAQLAGIRTLMNAQSFHLLEHRELMRVGPYAGYSHARFRMVMPCADGHVAALIVGGQLGGTAMRTLFDWAHAEGVAVDPAADAMDFREVNFATMDTAFFDGVCGTLEALFARHTKAEIYERAVGPAAGGTAERRCRPARRRAAGRPGFFQPLPDGTGTVPGRWARLSATPLRAPSPAPRIGQHGAEVLADAAGRRPPPPRAMPAPFEACGLDLSWVGYQAR